MLHKNNKPKTETKQKLRALFNIFKLNQRKTRPNGVIHKYLGNCQVTNL